MLIAGALQLYYNRTITLKTRGQRSRRNKGADFWKGYRFVSNAFRRIWNIARCQGWSFCFEDWSLPKTVVQPGDDLVIRGVVKNNGLRIGTVYVSVLIANPFDHNEIVFDSDRDMEEGERRTLRIVDLSNRVATKFAFAWRIPANMAVGVYDLRLQLWNMLPPKERLPVYLGSTLYVDMSGDDWKAEPMRQLLKALRRDHLSPT